jgi:hypothetical protein
MAAGDAVGPAGLTCLVLLAVLLLLLLFLAVLVLRNVKFRASVAKFAKAINCVKFRANLSSLKFAALLKQKFT